MEHIVELLQNGKIKEIKEKAKKKILENREDEASYLFSLISYHQADFDQALVWIEKAILYRDLPKYRIFKAFILINLFEFEEAYYELKGLEGALPNFLKGIALAFLDDPKYLQKFEKAYNSDPEKTMELFRIFKEKFSYW